MGGEAGEEWIHGYVWLSSFLFTWNYQTITTLLIDDTPKQNKKLKKRLFTDMENSIPRAKAGSHGADVWDKESIHLSRIAQA